MTEYDKPEVFSVVEVPLPTLRDNDLLVCGRAGLDKERG
jgi:hypothetical protein